MSNCLPITAELILTITALIVLIGSVFFQKRNLCAYVALLGLGLAGYSISGLEFSGGGAWLSLLSLDNIAIFSRMLVILITAGALLLSLGFKAQELENEGEYYFFLLILAISLMLAVSSKNLMMVYITLEAVSLVSYILAGYAKRDIFSSEAGIKYFIFGALSTGIMLYGISLLYGMVGSLDISALSLHSASMQEGIMQPLFIFALILVFVGVAFKCSLVPFHMWTPDVYQGAPTPVTALLSLGPKAMGFVLLLRLFVLNASFPSSTWVYLASIIAILTMTAGNVMALGQGNIKRLLAFSSIAHAGFILIGLVVGGSAGVQATLFYLAIYTVMNLAAFGAVIMASNRVGSDNIEDYAGLYKNDPRTAVMLAIALLSLAGIPPLAGFLAKFLIISSAVQAKMYVLALFAVINSAIALFYYLKVIKVMFLQEPKVVQTFKKDLLPFETLLWLVIIGNLVLGIWPQPIFGWLSGLLF